jgi:hypothetical protein
VDDAVERHHPDASSRPSTQGCLLGGEQGELPFMVGFHPEVLLAQLCGRSDEMTSEHGEFLSAPQHGAFDACPSVVGPSRPGSIMGVSAAAYIRTNHAS